MKIKAAFKKYDKATFIKRCLDTLIIEGIYSHVANALNGKFKNSTIQIDHTTETAYLTLNKNLTLVITQTNHTNTNLTKITTI